MFENFGTIDKKEILDLAIVDVEENIKNNQLLIMKLTDKQKNQYKKNINLQLQTDYQILFLLKSTEIIPELFEATSSEYINELTKRYQVAVDVFEKLLTELRSV